MVKKQAKKILEEALMKLLETTSIDNIDIRELTEKANLSRQTFYYNFKNKQDMLEWIFCKNNEQAQRVFREKYSLEDYFTAVLENILEYKAFYSSVLLNEAFTIDDVGPFESGIIKTIQETEMLTVSQRMDSKEWEALLFFAFGAKGMVVYWIKGGMKLSIDKMVSCLLDNMPHLLRKYINNCAIQSEGS